MARMRDETYDGASVGGALTPYNPAAAGYATAAPSAGVATTGRMIPILVGAAFAVLLLFGAIQACDSLRLTFDQDYRQQALTARRIELDRAAAEADAEAANRPAQAAEAAATRTVTTPVVLLLFAGILAAAIVGGGIILIADERERAARGRIATEKARAFVYPDARGYLPVSAVALLDAPELSMQALESANRVRQIEAYRPPAPRMLHIEGGGGYGPPSRMLEAGQSAPPGAALPAPEPAAVPDFLTLLTSGALDGDDLLVGFAEDRPADGAGLRSALRPVFTPFYRPYDRTHSQIIFGQADVGKSTAAAYQAIINGYAGRKSGRRPGAFLVYDPHAGERDSLAARITGLEPLFLSDLRAYTDLIDKRTGKPLEVPPLATRPEDLLIQLTALLQILDYRTRIGAAADGLPRVTLVADELSALYSDPDMAEIAARVTNILTRLNQQGRKFGLSSICASHQLSSESFGGGSAVLRRSFTSKLIFRLDPEEVASFLRLKTADVRTIANLGQGQLYYFSSYGPPVKLYEPLVRAGDLVEAVAILQRKERGARQFAAAAPPEAEEAEEAEDPEETAGAPPEAAEAEADPDADWMPEIPAEAFPFGPDGAPPEPVAAADLEEETARLPAPIRFADDWSGIETLTRRMESDGPDHLDGATFPPPVLEAVAYDLLRRRAPAATIHRVLWIVWRVYGGGTYNKRKKDILRWMDGWKAGPPAIPAAAELEVPDL
jgi:hypothetical protein